MQKMTPRGKKCCAHDSLYNYSEQFSTITRTTEFTLVMRANIVVCGQNDICRPTQNIQVL